MDALVDGVARDAVRSSYFGARISVEELLHEEPIVGGEVGDELVKELSVSVVRCGQGDSAVEGLGGNASAAEAIVVDGVAHHFLDPAVDLPRGAGGVEAVEGKPDGDVDLLDKGSCGVEVDTYHAAIVEYLPAMLGKQVAVEKHLLYPVSLYLYFASRHSMPINLYNTKLLFLQKYDTREQFFFKKGRKNVKNGVGTQF